MTKGHPFEPVPEQVPGSRFRQRDLAMARWDNEGGSLAPEPLPAAEGSGLHETEPALTQAELVQLRVRVIALENLLLVVLAQATDEQLGIARARAAYICPRPGFTRHHLTLSAAAQMRHLVGHAGQFCSVMRSGPDRWVRDAAG